MPIEETPLDYWNKFFEELQNESPRAAVIIAGAFLDSQLKDLLSKFFVDDPKVVDKLLGIDRPLSSFSSHIKTAYCLGLISKNIYQDLQVIRKIRNNFAHKTHGYTFDEPEIVNWCNSLKLAKMTTDLSPNLPKTHGRMFILSVTQLAMWLGLKILEAEKNRRTVSKDSGLGLATRINSAQ